MKNINTYINEKFQVSVDAIRNREDCTDEELRDDYETVRWAYTKKEKIEMGDKYGVTDYRIRPIQLEILDRLRENRFEKSEFNEDDILDFFRLEPSLVYSKFSKYLDNENKAFIEYMLEHYNNLCKGINPARCSYADKDKLKIKRFLNQYLSK